jgi:hypothetical protein
LFDLLICIVDDPIARSLECFRALLVALGLRFMHRAVNLEDHSPLDTAEVDDKSSNPVLATKLHSVELPISQIAPQFCFGTSVFAPKQLRPLPCSAAERILLAGVVECQKWR